MEKTRLITLIAILLFSSQVKADDFDLPLRGIHGELRLSQMFGNYYEAKGGFHSGEDRSYKGGGDGTRSVYAIGNGKVVKISDLGTLGKLVAIEHIGSFTIPRKHYTRPTTGQSYLYSTENVAKIYSVYVHLTNVAVVDTQSVTKNTKIGSYMDPDGGYHLHFEIRHPDTVHVGNWSLFGRQSNWAVVGGKNTGYYLNLQYMVDDGGREPASFIYANSPRDISILFRTGDSVRVTWSSLNIRSYPALWDGTVITGLVQGAQGQVLDATDTGFRNGVFADGYFWWYVQFGNTRGWCAQDGLERVPEPPTRVKGIDVSSFQGYVDWSEVYNAGYRFAFVRASLGDENPPLLIDDNFYCTFQENDI